MCWPAHVGFLHSWPSCCVIWPVTSSIRWPLYKLGTSCVLAWMDVPSGACRVCYYLLALVLCHLAIRWPTLQECYSLVTTWCVFVHMLVLYNHVSLSSSVSKNTMTSLDVRVHSSVTVVFVLQVGKLM